MTINDACLPYIGKKRIVKMFVYALSRKDFMPVRDILLLEGETIPAARNRKIMDYAIEPIGTEIVEIAVYLPGKWEEI